MEMNKEHKALRRRIAKRLGRSVSAAAWEFAAQEGFLGEALDPAYADAEDGLARFLGRLLQVEDRDLPARIRGSLRKAGSGTLKRAGVGARIEAISRLAADHAAGDAEILRFRRRLLNRENPMTAAEAEAYIDLPAARAPAAASPLVDWHTEVLGYSNLRLSQTVHVWPGSVLGELRKLALDLSKSYPWEPSQAAAFVLEGLVPLATPLMMSFPQTWKDGRPSRAKLVMQIDMWMPANEVLAAYRDAQRRVLPGHNRPIGPRSVAVVNFVMQHRSSTWRERLERWNDEHPDATYPDYRRFRFAFERAGQALFTPAYRPYLGPDL